MKKNLYYRYMIRRENVLKTSILYFFAVLSSYPRLLLEVFIRKDFGERYFRLSSAFTIAFILAVGPFIPRLYRILTTSPMVYAAREARSPLPPIMPAYLLWYVFLGFFIFISIRRHQEIKRNPSVFDFAKFSLFNGKIHPLFFNIQLPGKKTDVRLVETLLEPLLFFIAGLLLWLMNQKLGILLIVCSVFYSLSYIAAYRASDNFIMDKIDEMICNEEMEKVFMDDASPEETRGFRFIGRKPNDPDVRRKILSHIMPEEEVIVAR